MKTSKLAAIALGILTLSASNLLAEEASAKSIIGQLNYVGTTNEKTITNGYVERFWFRVAEATCDGATSSITYYILVNSRSSTYKTPGNLINFRNAYSTLLSAFLSGKRVEIKSNALDCTVATSQPVDIWNTTIGVMK